MQSWTEATTGAGTSYTREFDTDGRIRSHRDGSVNRQLAYDAASRITAAVDSGIGGTANWTYGYDGQDRLTSASNAALSGTTAGVNQAFVYDATGNRRRATSNGVTTDYTTDSLSNRRSQVGNSIRSYDAAGNTTDWAGPAGVIHATYSARNRLSQTHSAAPLATYAYNAWGERVGKQGTTYTQFVYDEDGHLIGEYDQAGRLVEETLWLDDTPIAVLKLRTGAVNGSAIGGGSPTAWQGLSAGGVEAFLIEPDQLDSPRAIVNQNHQLVWQWDSDPFGTTPPNEDPSSFGVFTFDQRFPGQHFDAESQTHYNYFRDYEQGAGRFTQSDPGGLRYALNVFAYVDNDPLEYADSDGQGANKGGGKGGVTRNKKRGDRYRDQLMCFFKKFCEEIQQEVYVRVPGYKRGRRFDIWCKGVNNRETYIEVKTGRSNNATQNNKDAVLRSGGLKILKFRKCTTCGGGLLNDTDF